jgi:hypothetical protein
MLMQKFELERKIGLVRTCCRQEYSNISNTEHDTSLELIADILIRFSQIKYYNNLFISMDNRWIFKSI